MKTNGSFIIFLVALSFQSILFAENWANWRGPNHNGSSNETNLPTTFSKDENVKWKVALSGVGASTPIIFENHVFLTSAKGLESSLALAYDRESGEKLWEIEFPGYGNDKRSNYSSPSAVTDGKTVVFFFGSGIMVAYNFDGNELWQKNIESDYGEFAMQWTFSSTPLLHKGHLYLQVLQRDEPVHGRGEEGGKSYLLALDVNTGKKVFRHIRPTDAQVESRESFSTPLPLTVNGREEIVVVGGDVITGHNLKTGEEIWRWGTWNANNKEKWWRIVPSPVHGDGVLLAAAPKGAPIYAIKAGLTGSHTDADKLAWQSEPSKKSPVTTDVATPLYYQGRFYVVDHMRTRALSCIDPKTGKVIYSENLGSREKFEVSPTGADGKIYLMNQLGDVFVVKAGDKFELLHKAELGDSLQNYSRASISVSQGNLFIRTDTHLYCIGE